MTRRILIIEDNSRDADIAARVASRHGLPIAVNSLSGAFELMRNQQFDLLIVDLTLKPMGDDSGNTPAMTIAALRVAIKKTPVIVTSGTADESVKQDVMLFRWGMVDKDTATQAEFEASLDAAIREQFEDSSGGRIDSQRDLILSGLERIETRQKELQRDVETLSKQVNQVCRVVLGYTDESGLHVKGCYENCHPVTELVEAGKVRAWHVVGVAAIALVTSVVSSLVALAFQR